MKNSSTDTGLVVFTVDSVDKGYWAWPSPAKAPDGHVPLIQNLDLPSGLPTSMLGDGVFINSVYDAASTITLATTRKVVGSDPVPVIATSLGKVWAYVNSAWVLLRSGLSTAAGIWWSDEQYGTDLFIANATDGIWRYDGNTLIPVGAKPIAQCESDEASQWTNETADTTNFKEGTQSFKVTSDNPGASAVLTFTPTADLNTSSGRLGAKTYDLLKASGLDCYHFWMRFSNGSGSTITAATTTFVITDTAGKTLTWDATKWHSTKLVTSAAISLTSNAWQEVFCFPGDATESATFNPTIVDKLEFKVTTSANATDMNIDDIYSLYLQTMPACQIVREWKNILFGFQADAYYFSPAGAPDEFHTNATAGFKSGGENVTGVARFFNQLTIGTESHILTLSGSIIGLIYPAYLFDINEVTDEIGIGSHRSIVKAENTLFWYWRGNIIAYTGTKADSVSYPVDPYLATLDESKAQFIVGTPFRGKKEIWWTWRRTGISVNDRILKFDYKWNSFITVLGLTTPVVFKSTSSSAEKFLTINETSRKIYEQNKAASFQFTGIDIAYALELPAMAIFGSSLQWMQVVLEFLHNAGNVLIQYRQGDTLRALQQATYTTAETIAMDEDGEYGKMRIGERSTWMQVKFIATGVKMELHPPFIVIARQQPNEFVRNTP